jgi:hypothetical protein
MMGFLLNGIAKIGLTWLLEQRHQWWKLQMQQARCRVLLAVAVALLLVVLIGSTLIWQLRPLVNRPTELMMLLSTTTAVILGVGSYAGWQWTVLAMIGVLRMVSGSVIPCGRLFGVGILAWNAHIHESAEKSVPSGVHHALIAIHIALFLSSTACGQRVFRLASSRVGEYHAIARLCTEFILIGALRSMDDSSGEFGPQHLRRLFTLLLHAFLIFGWISTRDIAILLLGFVSWEGATSWEDIIGFVPGIAGIYQFWNNIPSADFCRLLACLRVCGPVVVAILWLCGCVLGALGFASSLLVCSACAAVVMAELEQSKRMLWQSTFDPNCFICVAHLTGVSRFEEIGYKLEEILGNLSAMPANFVDFAKQLYQSSQRTRALNQAPLSSDSAMRAGTSDSTSPPPNPATAKLEANFKSLDQSCDSDILIAFFGGTGSGKSSVIKALLGEEHPDFDGILVGNAAGTTSCALAVEWKETPGGQRVWLVDVPGHGQPTRLGRGTQQSDGTPSESAQVVSQDVNDEAVCIQTEIEKVYPRVHLAVSVIRGLQPQRPFQEWNDHVREKFPGKRHVVLFNGQQQDPTARQWSKAVFEQEFDKLKKTYTGPLHIGDEPSNDWYCDVPGYDFRIDPEFVAQARAMQEVDDVKAKLLAFASESGPEAVLEATRDKEMKEVVQTLKDTAWSSAVGGAVAGGLAVCCGPVVGVGAGVGLALYTIRGRLRDMSEASQAEMINDGDS